MGILAVHIGTGDIKQSAQKLLSVSERVFNGGYPPRYSQDDLEYLV